MKTGIDVGGLTNIADIEAHLSSLINVNVRGCPNLWRACLEQSELSGVIDFSDCPNLAEIRCANNPNATGFILSGLSNLWHLCVHDDGLTSPLNLTDLTSLVDLWVWNCNQTGALIATNSPDLYDARFYSWSTSIPNNYSSADFTGRTHVYRIIGYGNRLTNCLIEGCTNLSEVDLRNNQLTTEALDGILAQLAANCTNGGRAPDVVILTNQAAKMSLAGWNNWTVITNHASQQHYTVLQADAPAEILPPAIYNVANSVLSSNAEAISWSTSPHCTNNFVDYGLASDSLTSTIAVNDGLDHSTNLTGLTPGATYYWQVRSTSCTNGMSATNGGPSFVAGYVPPIAFVSYSYSDDATWNETSRSVTVTPANGDLLVALIVKGTATPSAPGGWSTITNASCGGGGYIGLYYKENCPNESTTLTATCGSLHVMEFSGATTSGGLDVCAQVSDGASTSMPSVTLPALAATDELIVGGAGCPNGPMSAGSGYTGYLHHGLMEYRIGVPSTTHTVTATNETTESYGMIGVAFKLAN